MAVVLPLIREGQRWVEDCTRSNIVLVPLLSLGQHVLASPGTGVQQHSLAMSAALKAQQVVQCSLGQCSMLRCSVQP